MKTYQRVILIIGIALLAVGATLINISYRRGERAELPSGGFGISLAPGTPSDQKGYTVCTDGEESFDPAEVKKLDLDWVSGSVTVKEYDGKKLVVREEINGSATDRQRMRWRLKGGELNVIACASNINNLPKKDLIVLVPESMKTELLKVDVASADVEVSGLAVSGSIDIDSASGRISVEDCVCEKLLIDSASGAQSVRGCRVDGDLSADLASGEFVAEDIICDVLDIDGASGRITAAGLVCRKADIDTASGAVSLEFAKACEGVEIDTASAAVTLTFPAGTGLDIDFDSLSGKVKGDVKYGDLPVVVDTMSGNLTIKYN